MRLLFLALGAIFPQNYLKISFLQITFSRWPNPRPTESPAKASSQWCVWFGSLFRTNILTYRQSHRQPVFYNKKYITIIYTHRTQLNLWKIYNYIWLLLFAIDKLFITGKLSLLFWKIPALGKIHIFMRNCFYKTTL